MKTQTNTSNLNHDEYPTKPSSNVANTLEDIKEFKNVFQQTRSLDLDALFERIAMSVGKKSFLVFNKNKYINVFTENIAYFYIKYESSVIMCFDKQEYYLNQSLEQIQRSVSEKQFFRLNRQYLVNFNAIKEVEHYLARKLLVNLAVPVKDKLLVSKEKVTSFLHWLDNR